MPLIQGKSRATIANNISAALRPRHVETLTQKQEAFVLAYIKTGNASEAYRQVCNTNASAKTIHEKASRLLAEGKVWARYEILKGKVTDRAVEPQSQRSG